MTFVGSLCIPSPWCVILVSNAFHILKKYVCQQISFARTRADAVVKKLDEEHFEEHKAQRTEHKSALLLLLVVVLAD